MSTTIQDICRGVPRLDENGNFDQAARVVRGEVAESVADGLTPKRPPVSVDRGDAKLHWFTPEQALSVIVPTVSVNGRVVGYQREFKRNHARKMSLAMLEDTPFPAGDIAVDGNGAMYAVDCQHRLVAGVIARRPVLAVVRRLSKDEQRALFGDQGKAATVDRNVLILAGKSPYEQYVQAAVADDAHPWGQLVSANAKAKTRIAPYTTLSLLVNYVGNVLGPPRLNPAVLDRWDEQLADQLAPLVACFGDKQTNPAAFRAAAIRGIGEAATFVFRRNDAVQSSDYDRWVTHMPKFPWERWGHVRTSADFTFHLIAHWNKRLHQSRRVYLP